MRPWIRRSSSGDTRAASYFADPIVIDLDALGGTAAAKETVRT